VYDKNLSDNQESTESRGVDIYPGESGARDHAKDIESTLIQERQESKDIVAEVFYELEGPDRETEYISGVFTRYLVHQFI